MDRYLHVKITNSACNIIIYKGVNSSALYVPDNYLCAHLNNYSARRVVSYLHKHYFSSDHTRKTFEMKYYTTLELQIRDILFISI